MKSLGSTEEGLAILPSLGAGEEGGTHRVAVECVDTVRYPDGEGNPLACYHAEARKRGEQRGLDTPVVHALNNVHLVSAAHTGRCRS